MAVTLGSCWTRAAHCATARHSASPSVVAKLSYCKYRPALFKVKLVYFKKYSNSYLVIMNAVSLT